MAPAPGTYYVEIENISDFPFAYEAHITVGNARRIWGQNRFETAAEVSRLQWDMTGNPYYGTGHGPEVIVIANGSNPADALFGGPLAARLGGVLLLTHRDHLPGATRAEIERVTGSRFWDGNDATVYVLGGEAVVSPAVFTLLDAEFNVMRISGDNRYETAKEVALYGVDDLGMSGSLPTLVSGETFADGLAAAPLSRWTGGPLLLTTRSALHPEVVSYFDAISSIGEP